MARLDEVVTAIEIAVVLHRERAATRLLENAEHRPLAHARRERHVEQLYEHMAHVAPHPLVEDRHQKVAKVTPRHRPGSDAVALLESGLVVALDDWDEL